MRTVQKRNILEMIHTLHQAHDEIKRNMESKQYIISFLNALFMSMMQDSLDLFMPLRQ